MATWDRLVEFGVLFLPLLVTLVVSVAVHWTAHRMLIGRHKDLGIERMFPRQLVMLGLNLAAVVAIAITLPVNVSTRNQLLGLIGLVVSGIFAFSASTIFANLMAGIMLRVTKPFRTGDFVSVGSYFGRVAERGLLDTEVQSESRELIALPNTYLITNPVTVVRSSGTIVSVTLSLGYEVHHTQVENLLADAVKKCGLEDPFVHILALGNHSISYKASGLLTDIKSLLSARSNLCRCVLDTLHGSGIEILSPTFMNQRRLPDDTRVIPPQMDETPSEPQVVAEEIAFDKAEQAERMEKETQIFLSKIQDCEQALEEASEEDKKRLRKVIRQCHERLEVLDAAPGDSDTAPPLTGQEDPVEPDKTPGCTRPGESCPADPKKSI